MTGEENSTFWSMIQNTFGLNDEQVAQAKEKQLFTEAEVKPPSKKVKFTKGDKVRFISNSGNVREGQILKIGRTKDKTLVAVISVDGLLVKVKKGSKIVTQNKQVVIPLKSLEKVV